MPKKSNLETVLIIGSGPIVIGQAAEFDYAGTQACKAIREEGVKTILVNSNPATIMTDRDVADKVYVEPLTEESLVEILKKERPDLIITSGAAPAIPFFWIGKLMGAKTVYIEVFDRIDKSTISGKLCYPVTDKFIVQWEEMKKVYPKAINLGSIF